MKAKIKTVLVIACAIFQLNVLAQKKPTIVVGIPEEKATTVYLTKVDYTLPTTPETLVYKVTNNSFRFELNIDKPQLYRLYTDADTLPIWTTIAFQKLLNYKGFYAFNCYGYYQRVAEVFIHPGDSIHVQLIFDKKMGQSTSKYTGDRSAENIFLAQYRWESNTKRGSWPYAFFGWGGDYKKRAPEKVIKKAEKERGKYQQKIDDQKTVSKEFVNYLTNDNKATTFQLISNVLNRVDSLAVKLFFQEGKPFQAYQNLHTAGIQFETLRAYDRAAFVYAELLTNYQLNFSNKQFIRYHELSEDKYKSAISILSGDLAELYAAKSIALMIKDNHDKEKSEELIMDFKSKFPNSAYQPVFTQ